MTSCLFSLHARITWAIRSAALEAQLDALKIELGRQLERAAPAEARALSAESLVGRSGEASGARRSLVRLQSRRLTLDQRTVLVQLLSTDRGDVQVVGLAHDPESQEFAGELMGALKAGSWSVSQKNAELSPAPTGLSVHVPIEKPHPIVPARCGSRSMLSASGRPPGAILTMQAYRKGAINCWSAEGPDALARRASGVVRPVQPRSDRFHSRRMEAPDELQTAATSL